VPGSLFSIVVVLAVLCLATCAGLAGWRFVQWLRALSGRRKHPSMVSLETPTRWNDLTWWQKVYLVRWFLPGLSLFYLLLWGWPVLLNRREAKPPGLESTPLYAGQAKVLSGGTPYPARIPLAPFHLLFKIGDRIVPATTSHFDKYALTEAGDTVAVTYRVDHHGNIYVEDWQPERTKP